MGTKPRLSVPGVGRTIALATEERARHIRKAVQLLEPSFQSPRAEADFATIFSPRWDSGATRPNVAPTHHRAAWALVNVYLLARMAGVRAGLAEAESWFYGGHQLPSLAAYIRAANEPLHILSRLPCDNDLLELLPYVLETHGPGTRLSVMKDPSTRVARDAKRESGVFYTPADVAEYMVEEAMKGRGLDSRCLDPSCGNGVYLVALLRRQRDRFAYALRCLYGFDISTLSVESCTFVLLHYCLPGPNPWSAWHALRLNIAATDALRFRAVTSHTETYSAAANRRSDIRRRLAKGSFVEAVNEQLPTMGGRQVSLFGDDHLPPLGAVFPEAEAGFEILVGNPPYAAIGHREDRELLDTEYESLRGGNGLSDLYPPFIEMMWRLTKPRASTAALVVPLSIAYQGGGQFTACRKAMTSNGGRWRCAFFDRQPHALFGEDVKTRNAILFRSELPGDPVRGTTAEIETGPLMKWTSRTRATLFSRLAFTPLRGVSIVEGIPKLSGYEQSQAFTVLAARKDRLRSFCTRFRTCRPHEATLASNAPRVFIASTAYNFLNVFHSISVDTSENPLSENTIHSLEFADQATAEIVFAILSSRLTYWLWHIEGDGFHVNASFIHSLPFGRGSLTPAQAEALRASGAQLWQAVQSHRIVSLNKGKQTVAYRPLTCETERDAIDELLIEVATLPKRFRQTLKSFVMDTVVVDDTDARRSHLVSLFDHPEMDA